MAVIAGIYEDLITAINELWKNPKKQVPFLVRFGLGAGLGFLLFARSITWLLEQDVTGELLRFFFSGIVLGGIPLLVVKSGVKKVKLKHMGEVLFGGVIVLLLSFLPTGIFTTETALLSGLIQIVGGIIVAVALILPGISVSHMLYILGLYPVVLEHVYQFEFLELLPLTAGVIAGCLLTAKVLERLLEQRTEAVYLVIIGFVSGSVMQLFPQNRISHWIPDIIMLVAGFALMYWLSGREEKKNREGLDRPTV